MKEIDLEAQDQLSGMLRTGMSDRDYVPKYKEKIQHFRYKRPELKEGKKRGVVRLATTDMVFGAVQLFRDGGEDVMHSHDGMDGFWFVLSGHARFYDENNETFDVGPLEGVCIPRRVKYWFEKIGDDPLEILQVEAIHPLEKNTFKSFRDRMGSAPSQDTLNSVQAFDGKDES